MSETRNSTPWIIAVIVSLISSPLAVEIYKYHTNIQGKSNPATDSSSFKESLEVKYNSSIRNAIQAYFDIEKEVRETLETSTLHNYASGRRLNNLISSINRDKRDNYYIITDKQDFDIQSIKVLSDELEAKSRVSLVRSWRLYSSSNNECIDYYPKDNLLLDIILKRSNNKWLVDDIETVEKNYASKLNCTNSDGPRKRSNISENGNERTTVSGSSRRRTTGSGN